MSTQQGTQQESSTASQGARSLAAPQHTLRRRRSSQTGACARSANPITLGQCSASSSSRPPGAQGARSHSPPTRLCPGAAPPTAARLLVWALCAGQVNPQAAAAAQASQAHSRAATAAPPGGGRRRRPWSSGTPTQPFHDGGSLLPRHLHGRRPQEDAQELEVVRHALLLRSLPGALCPPLRRLAPAVAPPRGRPAPTMQLDHLPSPAGWTAL